MRIKGAAVLAALAAATVTVGVGPAATAEGHAPKQTDEHVIMLEPTNQTGARSAGGGGRGHDFSGDGIADILARTTNGALYVYPNSGSFNGTGTYPSKTYINGGWGGYSWLASADLTGDNLADVLATDWSGNLYVAVHSGEFDGTATLGSGLVNIGSGWNINDMVYVYDYNGDGFDDLLARRSGTGNSYVYFNNGGVTGTTTFQAPVQFMDNGYYDNYQNIADVTGDGSPDFIYAQDGRMYVIPLNGGEGAELGYGWNSIDTILFMDVDNDGRDDIVGRRWLDGTLLAYRHSGSYTPANGKAYGTFRAPVLIGTNWNTNDTIT